MPSVNEGAGGFHAYTVVLDGYGNAIAEDHAGKEIDRANLGESEEQAMSALLALTQSVWHKLSQVQEGAG